MFYQSSLRSRRELFVLLLSQQRQEVLKRLWLTYSKWFKRTQNSHLGSQPWFGSHGLVRVGNSGEKIQMHKSLRVCPFSMLSSLSWKAYIYFIPHTHLPFLVPPLYKPLLVKSHSFNLSDLFFSERVKSGFFKRMRPNYLISNAKLTYRFPAQIAGGASY